MRIAVPAGQGDFVFLYVKLWHVRDQIDSWGIVEGWPHRTKEFIELCDPGKPVEYDNDIQYQTLLQFEKAQGIDWQSRPTWEKVKSVQAANILLEANQHLEHGLPVADWLPDLPTNYHFPLHLSTNVKVTALKKLSRCLEAHPMKEGPTVGISCASYRGAEAWKTWGVSEWVQFLARVMEQGFRPVLIGGGWDDLTYSVACDLDMDQANLVGKTSVPEMVALLDRLDSYIGFSSGMTMTRTVLNKPALALWPDFQEALSRSWAPPQMLEDRRYVAHLWRPVNDVWRVARPFLDLCADELLSKGTVLEEDASRVLDS